MMEEEPTVMEAEPTTMYEPIEEMEEIPVPEESILKTPIF